MAALLPTFHRLTAPTYFIPGGSALPSGYDFINNGGGTGATPAPVDGVRNGGPNAGTYFIGFGDDATSANANRPAQALAQNTDYLDNLLHQDLAVPALSALTPSAGDTSFVAPAGTFCGVPGTPNTPAGILAFAKIVDQNGNEVVVPSSGQPCVVTAIAGAAVGSGFAPGPVTFTISPPIPNGVVYRVVYAVRSNLASLPVDALVNINIRSAQELPAAFEDFQKQIARFSGLNVAAVVGTIFETPDGSRLPRSSTQIFDIDPDGTAGAAHTWAFRTGRETGAARVLLSLDDRGGLPGTTGSLVRDVGIIDYHMGAFAFSDNNLRAYNAALGGKLALTALSERGGSLMVGEVTPAVADNVELSLLKHVNARWTVTCGDGTNSHGDFNGPDALFKAVQYLATHGVLQARVLLKAGQYTIAQASRIVLPDGMDLLVEGVNQAGVQIVGTANDPLFQQNSTGYVVCALALKHIAINWMSGNALYAIDFSHMALRLENVSVYGYGLFAERPQARDTWTKVLCAKSCSFESAGAAPPACITISCSFGSPLADAVRGILVEDCVLRTPSDAPAFRVHSPGSLFTLATIADVLFDRCSFFLGQASTNGAVMSGTAGVADFDNNNSAFLYLRDLTFRDCRVYAGTNNLGAGSSILMHLKPWSNGVASGYTAGFIGHVRIEGGRWEVVNNNGHTAFSPFLCAATRLTIRDVTFRGTDSTGNGAPTADGWAAVFGGAPIINADWAAYVFAVGRTSAPPAFDVGPGLFVSNVVLEDLARDGISGDLLLRLAGASVDVKGITLQNYNLGVTANLVPNHRARIVGPGTGIVSGLVVAANGNVGLGTTFVSNAGFYHDHAGYIVCVPNGNLHLKDCYVYAPTVAGGGNNGDGIVLFVPTGVIASTTSQGLLLEDCYTLGCEHGVVAAPQDPGHAPLGLDIRGGQFLNSKFENIYLAPQNGGGIGNQFHLREVRCASSQNSAGLGVAGNWDASADALNVVDSLFQGNQGGGGARPRQVSINYAAGDVTGCFLGNNAPGPGGAGAPPGWVLFQKAGAAVTPVMRGLATGFNPNAQHTNHAPMLLNNALLTFD